MTFEQWININNFNPKYDQFGEHEKMSYAFLLKLDFWREEHGIVTYINYGTQGEHSQNSYHYKGEAVDGQFKNIHSPKEVYKICRIGGHFNGIGIYPQGVRNGKTHCAFHVDNRTGLPVHWVKHNGIYIYKNSNPELFEYHVNLC